MLRIRLAMVIIVTFIFVLLLAITLYWGSNQVSIYIQRSETAYITFEQYERLSNEANRHFKQYTEQLILAGTEQGHSADVESSRLSLYAAMDQLRALVVNMGGTSLQTDDAANNKIAELKRVAQFSAMLDASEYRFKEVQHLHEQGLHDLALQKLLKYFKEEIDGKFQPLIDIAINQEREHAEKSKQELDKLIQQLRWIAILASLLAAVFSLVSGFVLLRGLRMPIAKLMQGTDEIASGNLLYRINLDTSDEFAYLAKHFNQMAQKLELQQQRLREGRAELENRVTERTIELHRLNEALIQMDNVRCEFLADISHELRTPITIIRGEAEVTLRGQDCDVNDYKDTLQRIVDLAMQLGKYVDDLLFIARNETDKLQFAWTVVDLSSLVADVVDDFRVIAQQQGLTVSLAMPAEILWVRGDKQRLRQFLLILGDNACRYSSEGGSIIVTLKVESQKVKISISDQGIGIPSQDLNRIFDRHFRSENARESNNFGSGLGLPMAKAIIQAHAGSISVNSTELEGSTFTAVLPLLSIGNGKLSYER
ncbi:ATP-binding protein [Methylomonas sp. AM2-LC]|uniref:sensor histidine kinase n=1 Tax=Methylomonas sp. AM2-LC TaxID=3153301 RepID=UPI0032676622